MSWFKSAVKLAAIWGVILAAFVIFSIYRDIKENKLFNYTDTYVSSEVGAKSGYQSATTFKYIFRFTAHDNYLGSISFKYFRLKDNPGQVIFRIREANQSKWYAENRYDFSYFKDDDNYHFGFPQIADSQNKDFILEFEIVTPTLSQKPNFLDLKTVPILTAKYVFPRGMFYKSPGKLATILINRSTATIQKVDRVKVPLVTLAIALVAFLILYGQESQARSSIIIRQKDLQKNVQLFGHWTNQVSPFYVPAGILTLLAIALISGNFSLAEKLAVYLWLTLLASAVFYVLQVTVLHRLGRLRDFVNLITGNTVSTLDYLMTKKALLVVGVLYVIISGLSSTYYLGGDDSRLFYIYPQDLLNNYVSKIVSDTGLSQLTNSIPPSSLTAFTVLMIGLRRSLPFLNLQAALTSANIIGGVLTFYLLIKYLISPRNNYERVICVLASLMYVFSIFNFYTLLNSRLVAEYLISLFPLSLHLAIKAVRESKFYLLVVVAVIWSTFNFISVTLPLSGAVLLTTLPLLGLVLWKYKVRLVGYMAAILFVFLVLNIHWLAFIPYTNFATTQPGASTPSITSAEFRKQNEAGIRTVSEINNSFFPLVNSYHQKIQFNFHWPQLPIYLSWYSKTLTLGYLFIAIVIWAGMVIDKDKSRIPLYIAAVANLALAIYFFTVNISPWGVGLFVWLTDRIPGFVIFRNMYDKFAFGLAFQWAIIIAVSLSILIKSLGAERLKVYLLFCVFAIVAINAKPFVLGEFRRLPYWTTRNSYDGIKAFNQDYVNLITFVKNQDTTGRYLSLPLLTGNSSIIQDDYQPNHYYAGVSPLLVFTGKNDLSGLISFSDQAGDVYSWIRDKDYEKFGRLLQKLNTKYVITNNSISTDLQGSFMFSDGLFYLQTDPFIGSVVGPKVQDFGRRYSLYKIAPKYDSEKIFITETPGLFTNRAQLSYKKLASHDYQIKISKLSHTQTLVFLDPYLQGWQLRTPSGRGVFGDTHQVIFDYANAWELDPLDIKANFSPGDFQTGPDGSVELNLRLYFQPYDYYLPTQVISASAYLLAILFVLKSYLRLKLT